MKAPVRTTLAVGFISVVMIVSLEVKHQDELVQTHQDAFVQGYKFAQYDIDESAMKRVTDKSCMAWWFNGDSTRVGKAIQKVAIK
jgi:hypothetical protein